MATRRMATILAVAAVLLVTVVGVVSADPRNAPSTTVITLDCAEAGSVDVLVQFQSSGAPTFDASMTDNGRQYVLGSIDARFHEGLHDVEPAADPAFAFTKHWGHRNGYDTTLACSASLVESGEFGTFTGFFDVVLRGK